MVLNQGIASGRMISLALALCMLVAGHPAWAQDLRWTQAGYGGGGRFTAIAVDPADLSRILVGSDVAGYFQSTDGGQTFTLRGRELGGFAVSALAFHPDRPGVVAVQASDGLYLSRDHGQTLTLLSPRLGYRSRFFGGCLLRFKDDKLLVATDTKGVFAVTWDAPAPVETYMPGMVGNKVNSLAEFGGELFAATERGAFRFVEGRFSPINDGLGAHTQLQDMASADGRGLYAVERSDGLFKWDAGQNRWARTGPPIAKPASGTLSFKTLALDPARPGRILMGTHPETWPKLLFVSEDAGVTWKTPGVFTLAQDAPPNWAKGNDALEALAFSPDGKTAWLADWWNLWRADAGGDAWQQVHHGLQNVVVSDVIRDPANPQGVLLATSDNGLMVSSDAGRSWTPSMKGVPDGDVRAVRVCPAHPAKRYLLAEPWEKPKQGAGVTFMLCKSTDSGASWKQLPFTVSARSLPGGYATGKPTLLVIDPQDEDSVFVGSNGHGLFKVNTVLLAEGKAEEAVANVSRTLPVPCFQGPDSLLVDPADSKHLTASLVGSGIWATTDGGGKWSPLYSKSPFSFGLASDPAHPQRIFAGLAEKKIAVSQDGGRTWREVALPGKRPPEIAASVVAVDPANTDTIYVGTSAYDLKAADGLFISTDGGTSFNPVPADLPRVSITAISPGTDGVLVGFNGLCLFRLAKPAAPDGK